MATARNKLKTLHKLAASKFNEAAHPRYPQGHPLGGQFMKSDDEIPLSLPNGRSIPGRQTTTLLELSAIAASETGNLSEDEVKRLHLVRNGCDSFEDFLNKPYKLNTDDLMEDNVLYAGSRVEMAVSTLGEVVFSVDNSLSVPKGREITNKPSEELIGMQSIFSQFLQSKAGNRVLANHPTLDTIERQQMRFKHYEKAGFMTVEDGALGNFMAMDNRTNPKKFAQIDTHEDYLIKGKKVKANPNPIYYDALWD